MDTMDAYEQDKSPDSQCYICGEEECGCGVVSLATINDIEPAELIARGGLEILKAEIDAISERCPTDASTEDGRKKIISSAMNFSTYGTMVCDTVEKVIKERSKAVEEENIQINDIKKAKKDFKQFCIDKRKEVRAPVNAWEDAEKEKERLAELTLTIEQDWDDAHALDRLRTLEAEAEVRKAREAQEAHDAQVAAEAAEKAKRDAETQAENRLREAVEREATAKAAESKAKADARAAEIKAEQDKKEAEFQAEQAAKQAEADKQAAVAEAEAKQKAAIAQAIADGEAAESRIKAEADARAADVEHQRKYNQEALEDITGVYFEYACDDTEDIMKKVLEAIIKGKIRHTHISY